MRDDDVRVGVANRVVEVVRGAHGIGEGDLAHATEAEVAEGALGRPTLDLAALERATLGGGGARRARRLLGRGAAGGGEGEEEHGGDHGDHLPEGGATRGSAIVGAGDVLLHLLHEAVFRAERVTKLVGHAAADGRHRDRGRGREGRGSARASPRQWCRGSPVRCGGRGKCGAGRPSFVVVLVLVRFSDN